MYVISWPISVINSCLNIACNQQQKEMNKLTLCFFFPLPDASTSHYYLALLKCQVTLLLFILLHSNASDK